MAEQGFSKRISNLRKAMIWSQRKLQGFQQHRFDAMKHFVGEHYAEEQRRGAEKVPLNMVWLAVTIYLRHLVPTNPKTLILTSVPGLKPTAVELEIALNHLLEEMLYAQSIREVVMEAMFCMGIMKVGIEVRDVGQELGWEMDAGQPFADPVLLDDWIHDMSASDYRQVAYAGNKYRMPYEFAMEGAGFSKAGKKYLKPMEKSHSQMSPYGTGGNYRSETLSQGTEVNVEQYEDTVELWDIWLPRQNLYVTIPADDTEGPALEVRDWEGPEHGPYHLLRFQPVPGNIIPIGPVQQWIDMSKGMNQIWRKLGRQAERQKEFYAVHGSAISGDGDTLREVDDGDIVWMNSPEGLTTVRTGGIDQQNLGFAINIKNTLAYLMGNIDAIGGLASQSTTLGQDQMLSQGANRMIDDMRQTLAMFNRGVFRDLGMYLTEDPYIEIPLVKRLGETLNIPFTWTQESMEGDLSQYNFQIEPFSQRSSTPEERLLKLNEFMMNIAIPGQFPVDPMKYAKAYAKYTNLIEIEDILDMNQQNEVQGAEGGRRPANTTRTYERISRAGPSTKGAEDRQLEQMMFSGGGERDNGATQGAG